MSSVQSLLFVVPLCVVAGAGAGLLGWQMHDVTIPLIATASSGACAIVLTRARLSVALAAACSLSLGHVGLVYTVTSDGDGLAAATAMLLVTYAMSFATASLACRHYSKRTRDGRVRSDAT